MEFKNNSSKEEMKNLKSKQIVKSEHNKEKNLKENEKNNREIIENNGESDLKSVNCAKEEVKTSGKMSKTAKLVTAILILAFTIIFLSVYSTYMTFAVYKKYYHSTLGDNLEFVITDQGNYIKSIIYPTSILSAMDYKQQIDIRSENLTNEMYVRVKVNYTDYKNNTFEVDVKANENWSKGSDGYYYFNDVLKSNEVLTFSDKIRLPKKDGQSVNSVLSVIVETLPTTFDILSIWQPPTSWLN